MNKLHQPVMLEEVMTYLEVKPKQWYLDATFGRGGHTEAIIQAKGKVIGLDCDSQAIEYGKEVFSPQIQAGKLILVQANFTQMLNVWKANHLPRLSGVLFDFGASTDQLLSKDRGFSFQNEALLDMRMDLNLGVKAKDLLQFLSVKQLTELFKLAGGETQAHKIALAIKSAPKIPTTTKELADLIAQVKGGQRGKLHPATKVFQSLRIAVNTEFENIKQALPVAFELLAVDGRLVALSFHEGEDRLVKNFFKALAQEKRLEIMTQKPLVPQETEKKVNPRARSGKLRAAWKK